MVEFANRKGQQGNRGQCRGWVCSIGLTEWTTNQKSKQLLYVNLVQEQGMKAETPRYPESKAAA